MLRKLFTKKTTTPPASRTSSKAIVIQDTWRPVWSDVELVHALTLLAGRQEEKSSDPFDSSLTAYLTTFGAHTQAGIAAKLYQSDPLADVSGAIWHHGREYELAIKGTPEAVLARCDITESEREDVYKALGILSTQSHDVIAVAYGMVQSAPLTLVELSRKEKLAFAGLISLV